MSELFFKNLRATFRTTIIIFFLLTLCALPVFPSGKDIKEQLLSEGGYQKIDEILQKRQVFTGSQDFTINKFHSDITIDEDSSFTVKEAIHVEFHRQRHGIYQEPPQWYVSPMGFRTFSPYSFSHSLSSVTSSLSSAMFSSPRGSGISGGGGFGGGGSSGGGFGGGGGGSW